MVWNMNKSHPFSEREPIKSFDYFIQNSVVNRGQKIVVTVKLTLRAMSLFSRLKFSGFHNHLCELCLNLKIAKKKKKKKKKRKAVAKSTGQET